MTRSAPVWRVGVRCASGARSFYGGGYDGIGFSDADRIWKRVAGPGTSIATTGDNLIVAGDIVYLEIQGSTLLLKRNGTNFLGPSTDTALTAGSAGIGLRHTVANSGPWLDTWEGGDFAAAGAAPQRTLLGVGT